MCASRGACRGEQLRGRRTPTRGTEMVRPAFKKSSRDILGCAVRKSWGTGTPEEKWPGIQKFLRIYRHLRGPSQNPRGGSPGPPVLAAAAAASRHEHLSPRERQVVVVVT